jgi:hypothetical protein
MQGCCATSAVQHLLESTCSIFHSDSMVAATTTHAPVPCQLLLVTLLLRAA